MPTFFETFQVVLVNGDIIIRADVPFRKTESTYNVKQVGVTVEFLVANSMESVIVILLP